MAVPKFYEFFPVVLRVLKDKTEKTVKQIRQECISFLDISEDDRNELLPSGRQHTVDNRINWAITYLKNAGLIFGVRRGVYSITEEGLSAFLSDAEKINVEYLERYESFRLFHGLSSKNINDLTENNPSFEETPQDLFEKAYSQINAALSEELLSAILDHSPRFFEQLVVDLLLQMGYGSALDSSGLVVGKSGDEGIDGIIREDKLGFSNIYIQAKRWDPSTTVGRPEVQKFVGALAGQGASKGLFITTAQFTKEAINYANKQLAVKVVLVDGAKLTRLMIEYGIGVSVQSVFSIKKIDSDYFEDDEK